MRPYLGLCLGTLVACASSGMARDEAVEQVRDYIDLAQLAERHWAEEARADVAWLVTNVVEPVRAICRCEPFVDTLQEVGGLYASPKESPREVCEAMVGVNRYTMDFSAPPLGTAPPRVSPETLAERKLAELPQVCVDEGTAHLAFRALSWDDGGLFVEEALMLSCLRLDAAEMPCDARYADRYLNCQVMRWHASREAGQRSETALREPGFETQVPTAPSLDGGNSVSGDLPADPARARETDTSSGTPSPRAQMGSACRAEVTRLIEAREAERRAEREHRKGVAL